jgi:hypothetical protein
MADFLSGLVQKAKDGVNNEVANVSSATGINIPDPSQQQSAGGNPSHPQDMMKGLHEAESSAKGFNEARKAAKAPPGEKKGGLKRFFKSAFGFGKSAHEGQDAVEDMTGQNL